MAQTFETTYRSIEDWKERNDRPTLTDEFLRFPDHIESAGSHTIITWMHDVSAKLEEQEIDVYLRSENAETDRPAYITEKDGKTLIHMLDQIDDAWDFSQKRISEPAATLRYLINKSILTQTLQRHHEKGIFDHADKSTKNALVGLLEFQKDFLRNRYIYQNPASKEHPSFIAQLITQGDDGQKALIARELTPGEWFQAAGYVIDIESRNSQDDPVVRVETKTHTYRFTQKQAAQIIAVERTITNIKAQQASEERTRRLRSLKNRRSRLYFEAGVTSSTKSLVYRNTVDTSPLFKTTQEVRKERQNISAQLLADNAYDEFVDEYTLRDRLVEAMVGGIDHVKPPNEANSSYRHRFINKLKLGVSNLLGEHQSQDLFRNISTPRALYSKGNQTNIVVDNDDPDMIPRASSPTHLAIDLSEPETKMEFDELAAATDNAIYALEPDQVTEYFALWVDATDEQREALATLIMSIADSDPGEIPEEYRTDDVDELSQPEESTRDLLHIGILEALPDSVHLNPEAWTRNGRVHEGKKQTIAEFMRAFFAPLPPLTETMENRDLTDERTILLTQSGLGQEYDHMTIFRFDPKLGGMRAHTILLDDFNTALGLSEKDHIYLSRRDTQERNEDVIWRKLQRIAGLTRENALLVETFPTDLETRTDYAGVPSADADRIRAWFAALQDESVSGQLRLIHFKGPDKYKDQLAVVGSEATISMDELRTVLDLPWVPLYTKYDNDWKGELISFLSQLSVDGRRLNVDVGDFLKKEIEIRKPAPTYNPGPLKEKPEQYRQAEAMAGAWPRIRSVELTTSANDGALGGFIFHLDDGNDIFVYASVVAKVFNLPLETGFKSFTVGMIKVNASIAPDRLKQAFSELTVHDTRLAETVSFSVQPFRAAQSGTPRRDSRGQPRPHVSRETVQSPREHHPAPTRPVAGVYNPDVLKDMSTKARENITATADAITNDTIASVRLDVRYDGLLDGFEFRRSDGTIMYVFASSLARAFNLKFVFEKGRVRRLTIGLIDVQAGIEKEQLKRALSNLSVGEKKLSDDVQVTVRPLREEYSPRPVS